MSDKFPRVSELLRILDDSYAGVPAHVLEAASERGNELHRLCLSYLAHLDGLCPPPSPIADEYRSAYAAFVVWVTEQWVIPVVVEHSSESLKHGYRGTPDALVQFGPHHLLTILDLKFTAAIIRTNRVQVQAYWRLDAYKDADRVMLVHINPHTGDLTAHKITKNPHDWAAFLSALNIWKWRQQ